MNFRKSLLVGLCLVAFAACSFLAASASQAEQLRVGILKLNQVYEKYERINDFRKEIQKARQKMLELQKEVRKPETDKEKIKQRINKLKEQVAEEQREIQEDIKKAVEKIAQRQDLSLIVPSVLYKDQSLQLQDVTQQVIQLLNDSYEGGGIDFF